ncbi:hypothetical protein D3C80_1275050 [compost metagenome]
MAKPAEEPTCRISSTGSKAMMPKATAPLEKSTPRKLHSPDHTTATGAGNEWVYITVATALAVSWKPLTNSKPRAISNARPSSRKGVTVVITVPLALTSCFRLQAV